MTSSRRIRLDVDDLSVTLGRGRARKTVLQGVSLTVHEGEAVGLIGETGSGKTTLARSIVGLARAASGSIRFAGTELTTLSPSAVRAHRRTGAVQYVFQDPLRSLDPDLTVRASLSEPLRIAGDLTAAEIAARVEHAARSVRLDLALLGRRPGELSGGQRQRVGLARALVVRPRLLILDEPVSALDAATRVQVLEILAGLRDSGVALLFISHDLGSVAGITSRTAVLYRGALVEVAPTSELINEPQHPYSRLLVASAPTLHSAALDRTARAELRARLAETVAR
jgi:ABC-type dipeptide/oligopeptide/nickel transport system ATPase subunit